MKDSNEFTKAYVILGVEKGKALKEIKKKYRGLIKEYEPDDLIRKGLPSELTNVAQKKI